MNLESLFKATSKSTLSGIPGYSASQVGLLQKSEKSVSSSFLRCGNIDIFMNVIFFSRTLGELVLGPVDIDWFRPVVTHL